MDTCKQDNESNIDSVSDQASDLASGQGAKTSAAQGRKAVSAKGPLTDRRNGAALKYAVDYLLTACLLLSCFAPNRLSLLHQVTGIAITVLLIVHIVQHGAWFRGLSKGRWTNRRAWRTVLVELAFACMAVLVVSGYFVPGTRAEFDFIGVNTTAGELHRFMALIGFLASVVHGICLSRRSSNRKACRS
jgi:hypothetical protein